LLQVSAMLGLCESGVRHHFRVFLAIIGIDSLPGEICQKAEGTVAWFEKRLALRKEQQQRAKYRQSLAVGGELPPEELDHRWWEEWHILKECMVYHSQIFDELRERFEFRYDIVVARFGLVGSVVSVKELASRYGVTKDRIYRVLRAGRRFIRIRLSRLVEP